MAGAFLEAGEERANHNAGGACGDGLGNIAGVLYASVGDNGDTVLCGGLCAVDYGGHLRHADAGDYPRGADCARSDADFDGVGAGFYKVLRGLSGGDISGDDVDVVLLLYFFDGIDDVLGVAVGGIDYDQVNVGSDEGLDPLVFVDADGGSDAEPAALVSCGYGVLLDAVDIPHSNKACQLALSVDQEQLLDLVLLEYSLGLFEGGSGGPGDEVGLCHHGTYLDIVVLEELEVPASEDADELFAPDDRDAGDILLVHKLLSPADGLGGGERNRVEDDAVLGAFYFGDLSFLGFDGEVFVDYSDAAFLGERNCQGRLCNGVHSG